MPEHTLIDLDLDAGHRMTMTRGRAFPRLDRGGAAGHAVRAALAGLVALTLAGGVAVAAPMSRSASPVAASAPLLAVPAPPVAAPSGEPRASGSSGPLGPPSCVGAACRGRNPHSAGCDRDAVTVGQSLLTTRADPSLPGWGGPVPETAASPAESVVGYVQVRWSPSCRAGWALALATASCAIGTLVVRRDDDVEQSRALPALVAREPSRAYTAMLDAAPGAGRLVGLVAPPDDGRGLVRDSTGFVAP